MTQSHREGLNTAHVQVVGRRLMFAGCAAGSTFGYSIAVSNNATEPLRHRFALSAAEEGVVVSALTAGALAGCVIAGRVADRFGRRPVLGAAGLLALIGALGAAGAVNMFTLATARLLLGAAVGVTSAVTPMFLAERAPARQRGALVTSYQLAVAAGNLLSLGAGAALSTGDHWRLMFALNGLPALAQITAMAAIRGPASDQPSAPPTRTGTAAPPSQPRQTLATVPWQRRPATIAICAALMNALVGVGAVVYYSTPVFGIAGVGGWFGAQIATLSVGLVNVLASVLALYLIQRHGRRSLLSVGLGGIILSLVTAGITLLTPASSLTGAITISALLAFMACYAISAGPVAWLLVAEVLPEEGRARTAATATGLNWAANLMVTLLFPIVVGSPGTPRRVGATLLFFAALSTGFLLFVRLWVPETRNRPLGELAAPVPAADRMQRHPLSDTPGKDLHGQAADELGR
jgi:MFS family permease